MKGLSKTGEKGKAVFFFYPPRVRVGKLVMRCLSMLQSYRGSHRYRDSALAPFAVWNQVTSAACLAMSKLLWLNTVEESIQVIRSESPLDPMYCGKDPEVHLCPMERSER